MMKMGNFYTHIKNHAKYLRNGKIGYIMSFIVKFIKNSTVKMKI
jgi:hypothetical protein